MEHQRHRNVKVFIYLNGHVIVQCCDWTTIDQFLNVASFLSMSPLVATQDHFFQKHEDSTSAASLKLLTIHCARHSKLQHMPSWSFLIKTTSFERKQKMNALWGRDLSQCLWFGSILSCTEFSHTVICKLANDCDVMATSRKTVFCKTQPLPKCNGPRTKVADAKTQNNQTMFACFWETDDFARDSPHASSVTKGSRPRVSVHPWRQHKDQSKTFEWRHMHWASTTCFVLALHGFADMWQQWCQWRSKHVHRAINLANEINNLVKKID